MTPLKLPEGEFDAYLFDCDGTLADSMPLHFEAWSMAVSAFGVEFPEELFYEWGGIPVPKIVERLSERYGVVMPAAELLAKKEGLYYELLPKLKPIESVVHHVRAKHGSLPFAVVSGSPRESIAETLRVVGLAQYFPVIVGAEDYARGKPHPEPFLLAAKLLGVRPEKCLVFEDADLGIESARAAGMAWVKVERQAK